jgi:hypothetical protein
VSTHIGTKAPAAQVVWLNIDHPKVGAGWRRWVAIERRKWVNLVLVSTGEHIRIGRGEFTQMKHKRACTIKASRTLRHLRENAKTFGNESAAVKEAIAALRGTQ